MPRGPDNNDDEILREAKERFQTCVNWESEARTRFDYDYKFANGDSHNMYQWDQAIVQERNSAFTPCLTINKTQQHNLQVINDAKQNKPGVNIRPVGENASFEAAQVFQEVVRHIEYISNAESVYDNATSFQVQAGIGYWRVCTDYIDSKSFDQEIYIKPIRDPRKVYLDPDINEDDGSDARFGYIFDDMPKKLFDDKYPKYKDEIGWTSTFQGFTDTWLNRGNVRVAEYYRKSQKEETLVAFLIPDAEKYGEFAGDQVVKFKSELNDFEEDVYKELKEINKDLEKADQEIPEEYLVKEREVLADNVEWFKIAGDKIIERGAWLGKYVPIVRLVGTETIIDGILDRKGHTRALINAQQMYNYNTSANVEYGALQTKAPWIASAQAIEGYEEYYRTANSVNHSYMPYNAIDEDGNKIDAPVRPAAPQASPAYVRQMEIAQNEMMMASGQYQSQMGENENAKSGVAINARQRQGDRATYHFIDNNAKAIRFTGKILIDLIPKVYDTKRVMRISANDGTIMEVTIDPKAEKAAERIPQDPNEAMKLDKQQQIVKMIFNPSVGLYDVQSEVGPSFATRRQEAFNALTQIAAQNENFMGIAGDILWKVADFPEAQVLAERWRKIIPPNITGDGPDPKAEAALSEAANKIEQQLSVIAEQAQEIADKDKELTIRAQELDLRYREAAATQARLDYEAETKRLAALGNSGPALSIEQLQPVIKQMIVGMLRAGEPGDVNEFEEMPEDEVGPGLGEGGTPTEANEPIEDDEEPPVEGARKARDGNWYVEQDGGFARVDME